MKLFYSLAILTLMQLTHQTMLASEGKNKPSNPHTFLLSNSNSYREGFGFPRCPKIALRNKQFTIAGGAFTFGTLAGVQLYQCIKRYKASKAE